MGDKAHRILANKLKGQGNKLATLGLSTPQGDITYDFRAKANLFRGYYSRLYTKGDLPIPRISEYLDRISLPTLTPLQREALEAPIHESEIDAAIKSLKLNKGPGPDEFSAEFYQIYAGFLLPMLKQTFDSFRSTGQ
mgnify:CR=1 FL=1